MPARHPSTNGQHLPSETQSQQIKAFACTGAWLQALGGAGNWQSNLFDVELRRITRSLARANPGPLGLTIDRFL